MHSRQNAISIAHAFTIDSLTCQSFAPCKVQYSPPISCTLLCTCQADPLGLICLCLRVSSVITNVTRTMLSQQFFAIKISLDKPWLSTLILQPNNIPLCLFVSLLLSSPVCLQRFVFGLESLSFTLAGMTVSYLIFLISRPHSHMIQMLL